jgi:chemotaxis protein CheX
MSATPESQHLQDITESVWVQFLGLALELVPNAVPLPAECASAIGISGAWNGHVAVGCSRALARQAAARMFHHPEAGLSDAEWQDALKEIANIIGGNIKALLPSPSRLELPVFYNDWTPSGSAHVVTFAGAGGRLQVMLLE